VEDDHLLSNKLSEILSDEGFSTAEAFDGREAMQILDESPIDLVLLDLDLPHIHGMDVLRHVEAHHPAVQTIILSETGAIPITVEALYLGVFDFIEKGEPIERILHTIHNALDKPCLQRHHDRFIEEMACSMWASEAM